MGFSGEEPFYGEKGRRGFDRLCQCINSQTVCLSCIAISKTMNYNISNRRCNQMKDSTVSARVENDIKNEAEDILQKLGVPVSVVINSLYRQIIYHHGIPFSLTVPSEPRTLDAMSDAELDAKLQHSYAQSVAGEGRPLGDVFDDLERSLG